MNISQELKARLLQRLHEKYPAFGYRGSEEEIGRDIGCYFSDFAELLNLLERHHDAGVQGRRKSIRERIRPLIGTGRTSPFYTAFPVSVFDKEGNVTGTKMQPALRADAFANFLAAVGDAFIEAIEDVREAEKLESVAAAPASGSVQHGKFNPQSHGGIELCIVVSWQKSGKKEARTLAMALKNKAHVKYQRGAYPDPARWYEKDPGGFANHCFRLRRKAKANEWYERIPHDFWKSYK